jgi:DNA polymerase-4
VSLSSKWQNLSNARFCVQNNLFEPASRWTLISPQTAWYGSWFIETGTYVRIIKVTALQFIVQVVCLKDCPLIACFYLPDIGIAAEISRVPFYKGEPLALANTGGVLQAASSVARKAGVQAGMTISGARALCRNLIVLPYNRPIYEEAAEAVWDMLATESSRVEPVSPELSFVEFSDAHSMHQAEFLGSLLAKHIGIEVNIGLGSSKLVAEQAARKDDRHPPLRVQVGMEAVFLASVPISVLRSISPNIQQRLMRLGVNTLGDVLRLPDSALSYQFKEVARKLQKLAVGDDGDVVQAVWPPPTVEREIVFDDEVGRVEEILAALNSCSSFISRRLEEEHTYCRRLTLKVTLSDRTEMKLTEPLRSATNQLRDLTSAAQRLLGRMALDQGICSVMLAAGALGAGAGIQLTLLGETDQTREELLLRERRLEETMAYVRKRFGVRAVVPATLFHTMRQVQLLVYPLGQRKRESVMVATDSSGSPQRFYRHKNCVRTKNVIAAIQDQWCQASWSWDKILETHCYRVVTDPWGLHQLEQLGVEWTLTATAD